MICLCDICSAEVESKIYTYHYHQIRVLTSPGYWEYMIEKAPIKMQENIMGMYLSQFCADISGFDVCNDCKLLLQNDIEKAKELGLSEFLAPDTDNVIDSHSAGMVAGTVWKKIHGKWPETIIIGGSSDARGKLKTEKIDIEKLTAEQKLELIPLNKQVHFAVHCTHLMMAFMELTWPQGYSEHHQRFDTILEQLRKYCTNEHSTLESLREQLDKVEYISSELDWQIYRGTTIGSGAALLLSMLIAIVAACATEWNEQDNDELKKAKINSISGSISRLLNAIKAQQDWSVLSEKLAHDLNLLVNAKEQGEGIRYPATCYPPLSEKQNKLINQAITQSKLALSPTSMYSPFPPGEEKDLEWVKHATGEQIATCTNWDITKAELRLSGLPRGASIRYSIREIDRAWSMSNEILPDELTKILIAVENSLQERRLLTDTEKQHIQNHKPFYESQEGRLGLIAKSLFIVADSLEASPKQAILLNSIVQNYTIGSFGNPIPQPAFDAQRRDYLLLHTLAKTENWDDRTKVSKESLGEIWVNGKPGAGCFIATACYGSEEHPDVMILRHFRDNVLLKSHLGTRFVNYYYRYSPPIAEELQNRAVFRSIVRRLLIRPLALIYKVLGSFSK